MVIATWRPVKIVYRDAPCPPVKSVVEGVLWEEFDRDDPESDGVRIRLTTGD